MSLGERIFGGLIRLYPRAFRERYRDDLLEFFRQDRRHPKYGSGPMRPVRFWTATLRDLGRAAWSHRRAARQEARMFAPRTTPFARLRWDLRFAWRGLWAAPGVTFAALAVLVIGIGASTAIFSVVDAVMLRGLPYPDDRRLTSVTGTDAGRSLRITPQDYADYAAQQASFSSFGASWSVLFTTIDEPVELIYGARVSVSLLQALGVPPARGRSLTPDDERAGAPAVALISHRLWRRLFTADPDIVGRTLSFKTGIVQVVGVMPAGFTFPLRSTATTVDVWVPYIPSAEHLVRGNSRNYMLTAVGRLKPGVTVEQAAADLNLIRERIVAAYPRWLGDQGLLVRRMQDAVVGARVQSWMWLLLAAVGGVLLIACLNVANLLVARAISRGPELAVRTALGASRWDVARALLVESVLLSLLGAAGGLMAALWGVEVLRANLPGNIPRLGTVAVDLRIMAVAVATAVATGVVFGLLPALQASRPNIMALAGSSGRSVSGGRGSRRLRAGLILAEVAVATVLLTGSGLFLKSFVRVASIDLGFDPTHVMSLTGSNVNSALLRPPETPEAQEKSAAGQSLVKAALERLAAVPGVTHAAAVSGGRPLGGSGLTVSVQHADRLTPEVDEPDQPWVRAVTPAYLPMLRGTLARGRWFTDADVLGTVPVMVLSDEAAGRYYGPRDPIGQTLLLDGFAREVVGVIRAMRPRGPEETLRPEVFIPLLQTAESTAELMVRTDPGPLSIAPALRAAVRAVMPTRQIQEQTLEQHYATLLAERKFNMMILAIFGVVAIMVAAIGIYGLMAFVVAQRRREIGVRLALGAAPAGILRMMLRGAAVLMVVGLGLGLGAALLLEQSVRAFLFNPQRYDPIVYGAVAVLLFAAGVLAALGPARRAARVDPLTALRMD